jgi:UvrD-like helicase C-terminal domain
VVGGVRFYERREVRDALAYLRAVTNLDDTVSVRRILNTPRRGHSATRPLEGALSSLSSGRVWCPGGRITGSPCAAGYVTPL